VVEIVRDYTGSSIAKRQVEELAVRAAQDFDAFYEQRAAARDPKDDLLVVSTDGKGVVMRHEDLREGTRKAAEKSVHKLQTRLAPGEKSNRKRMAQVATVYSIAPFPRGAADIACRNGPHRDIPFTLRKAPATAATADDRLRARHHPSVAHRQVCVRERLGSCRKHHVPCIVPPSLPSRSSRRAVAPVPPLTQRSMRPVGSLRMAHPPMVAGWGTIVHRRVRRWCPASRRFCMLAGTRRRRAMQHHAPPHRRAMPVPVQRSGCSARRLRLGSTGPA
jgi:hypothetical protein